MKSYKIAVIAGDGIGQEVVPEGIRVVDAVAKRSGMRFEWEPFDWSCKRFAATGAMMPDDGLERIRNHDAIFLGAVGFPGVPDHVSLWGLLIPIRRRFQQYVNLRPVRLMPGIASPLAGRAPGDIDFWIVRENTEGEYSAVGGRFNEGTDDEIVIQETIFTRRGVDRILRYAYELRQPPAEEASDLGDQVERHRDYDAVLGRARQSDGGAVPDSAHRPVPHRHPDGALRAAPGLVRRRRRLESLRRHPLRPGPGLHRNDRHRALRQPQSRARVPLDVRAGARLGAGHRRQAHRQPDRSDLVGRDDARPPRPPGAAHSVVRAIETVLTSGPRTPDIGGTANTEDVGKAIAEAVATV